MTSTADNPFELGNDSRYQQWRAQKLASRPRSAEDLLLEIDDPRSLSEAEITLIRSRLNICNMLIYKSKLGCLEDKDIPRKLGQQLGLAGLDPNMLADDDGITSLTVVEGKNKRGYIPYSDKRLLWHTDGYYNASAQQIRAFILHCVRPAVEGGENALLDPEMVYLRLRDENPDYIKALMHPEAMTIPANTESGAETRPAQTGPVFSLDPATGRLHMRYTARTRSIVWRDDEMTRKALAALEKLLSDENPDVFHYRLGAGEGVLSNNVLHNRTAFRQGETEAEQRLLYRARYYARISTN
ncbi:TauD/TfdA family dioxygenase [Sulfuriflexus mobilis]|uniref:TauD/TfdA family dioxygenase n=1 Tax=Sulfuriflexus mobilis TaxID=1811807 RepID=UPI000F849A84|nr:TauD/TfdA family dioxygenase [Sulfuriflexus mobilis]